MKLDNISVTQEGEGITIRLNSAESTARLNGEANESNDILIKTKYHCFGESNGICITSLPFISDILTKLEKTIGNKNCLITHKVDAFSACLKNCETLDEMLLLFTTCCSVYEIGVLVKILSICGYKIRANDKLYKNNKSYNTDTDYTLKVYKSQMRIQHIVCLKSEALFMKLQHKHNSKFEMMHLYTNSSEYYLVYY